MSKSIRTLSGNVLATASLAMGTVCLRISCASSPAPSFGSMRHARCPPAWGLGLATVEAAVLRGGFSFSLSRAETDGLCAQIRLRRA